MEAIRQVKADWGREHRLANYLESVLPWSLTPTPAFYFTDYHINRKLGQGRESYIGDVEMKWLNTPSTQVAIFNYNKLQLMAAVPVYTQGVESYHRVCFRFTDGLFIVPVEALQPFRPIVHNHFVREDVTKLVVRLELANYMQFHKPIIIR